MGVGHRQENGEDLDIRIGDRKMDIDRKMGIDRKMDIRIGEGRTAAP